MSDILTMAWDALPTVGQHYYALDWDGADTVIVDCAGDYCPDEFPLTVTYTLAVVPTYTLWVDLEARNVAGVLAATSIETAMIGAPEPGIGQHDGEQPWAWEPGLPSRTQFVLWRRLVWRGAGLPDLISPVQMDGDVVLAQDERGFALAGEYESGERIDLTGGRNKQIKPVLYVDDLAIFEEAIAATGEKNRGEAILEVCRYYLKGLNGEDTEGQLDL